MRQVKTKTQHTRSKFIVIHAYIRKEERSQMDKLIVHFKELTYERKLNT